MVRIKSLIIFMTILSGKSNKKVIIIIVFCEYPENETTLFNDILNNV